MSGLTRAVEGWREEWATMRHQARLRGPVWIAWQVALSVAALGLIGLVVYGLGAWAFGAADWTVVAANLRLFSVGRYPADEIWRPATVLALVTAMSGWEAGRTGRAALARFFGGGLAVLLALPFLAPLVSGASPSMAAAFAAFAGGHIAQLAALGALAAAWWIGARASAWASTNRPRARRLERASLVGYGLVVLAILILLRGGGGLERVSPSDWGGLLLTLLLAAFAIVLSFPIGVLLALGRRSSLPLVRWVSVAWIEVIRGVPLVTVLYMASLLLPLVLPEGWNPENVAKAVAGLTAFASAYVAEDVRGGLAAVAGGQYDAAKAVGLGTVGMYRLVVLPQAIRAAVPAIAGQFISLFKDTALVLIISLRELLGIAIVAANQPAHIGRFRETLAFIAIIYFAFTAVLSSASRRLEAPAHERERDDAPAPSPKG